MKVDSARTGRKVAHLMSQFSDFLQENGIKAEDVVATSAAIEKLTVADRDLLVKRRDARREKKSYAELELGKPSRSGRGVSPDTTRRATDGSPIPRTARKKLLRAVNARLASAKKDAVDAAALFGEVAAKTGKKK